MTPGVGRLLMLMLTYAAVVTGCGSSKTTEPRRCGVTLDGHMLLPGTVKRLDYSMRTRTINGRERVEKWRIVGNDDTALYRADLVPAGGSLHLIWPAGEHVYAVGCSDEPHRLQASKITVG
jgi:hypothetical protein